jgi:hypothetical protein
MRAQSTRRARRQRLGALAAVLAIATVGTASAACDPTAGQVASTTRPGRCDALPGFGTSIDTALVEAAAADPSLPKAERARAQALLEKYERDWPSADAVAAATAPPRLKPCPDFDGFASYVRGPGPARPRVAQCMPCPAGLAADAAKAACVRDPRRGPAPVADVPLPPLPPPRGAAPPPAAPSAAPGLAIAPPAATITGPPTTSALVQAPPSSALAAAPKNNTPAATPATPPPKPPPAPFCYEAFWRPTPAAACNYRDPLPGTARCANATATGCTVATCCVLTCGRDFHDALALNTMSDQQAAQRRRREACTANGGHPAPDARTCPPTGCTPERCCDKADVRCWSVFDKAGGAEKFCPAARRPKAGDAKCPAGANGCTQDACCEKAPTCEAWFKAQPRPNTPCDVYLPKDKNTACPGSAGLCDRAACCDLGLQQCSLVRSAWWRPSFACPKGYYLDGAARCREPCADSALTSSCCKKGAAPPAAPKPPAPPAVPQGSFFG